MWDPQHTVIIVNPNAGGKRVRSLGNVETWLAKHLPGASIQTTQAQGHAKALAIEAIRGGARTIVSFGGDGTHSEIVDGVMNAQTSQRIRLGVLHAGSGGDFRKLIQHSEDLEQAAEVIRDARSTPTDVGHVSYVTDEGQTESRHFVNITTVGIGGLVDRYVNRSSKPLGGQAAYFTSTLLASLRYKPAKIRLEIDGEDKGIFDINVLCVCNGRYAGGGMKFAPHAIVDDGLFDVVVIRYASTLVSFPTLLKLYKGEHLSSRLVSSFRGRAIKIEMLGNQAWMDIDGEAPGFAPATFSIRPQAIEVIGLQPEVTRS